MPKAARKKNIPISRKKDAEKRYVERLCSLIAKKERNTPIIIQRKEAKIGKGDVSDTLDARKSTPISIKRRPMANTTWAARRIRFWRGFSGASIYTQYQKISIMASEKGD
jgi:hypothetical protein